MAELFHAVDVDAPVEATWAALVDWPGQREWMLGTRVRPVDGDGHRVGDRLLAVTGLGPLGLPDRMEIVEWQPPHRCLVRHLGPAIVGTGAFEVLPRGEGRSRFVWSEWVDPPLGPLGELGFLALKPLLLVGYRVSMDRFARWVVRRSRSDG